jgi:hypothetical protein
MAKLIEFYIPNQFQKKVRVISPRKRGKVVEISRVKKSA